MRASPSQNMATFIVSEVLDVGSRHSLGDRFVPEMHRFMHRKPWVVLLRLYHFDEVHFRYDSNKLDEWIDFALVLEIADFSSVKLIVTASEI